MLLSKDKFLINVLRGRYGEIDLKQRDDIENYNVIIFDMLVQDEIQSYIGNFSNFDLNNYLIVNIGEDQQDGILNIRIPFRIRFLVEKIDNFNKNYSNFIIKYFDGTINVNSKTFSNKTNIIHFTAKEIGLINFLFKNGKSDKAALLDKVWNTKAQNDKIVETVIYNVKQKFKDIGMESPILYNNSSYSIREPTAVS
ncbi:MAG: hypothetical protein LBS34_03015 [Rickettsiales bacterium]|nr:hypothetical protein [Rickettsiales bacterium]